MRTPADYRDMGDPLRGSGGGANEGTRLPAAAAKDSGLLFRSERGGSEEEKCAGEEEVAWVAA